MIESKQADKVKRIIIGIAYVCYMSFLFFKNNFHIDLHYYELVIGAFIGLLLKLADSTQRVVKLLNSELSPDMTQKINEMLNTIKTNSENISNDITIAPVEPIEYIEKGIIPAQMPEQIQNTARSNNDYIIEIEYPTNINYPY